MDTVDTDQTAIDERDDVDDQEYFRQQGQRFSIYDRARMILLRRAVVDHELDVAAKLLLFVLAEHADVHDHSARMSYAELQARSGLDVERIGRGLGALRVRHYLTVEPGEKTVYTLCLMRAVGGAE
jgi:hypothetical protein